MTAAPHGKGRAAIAFLVVSPLVLCLIEALARPGLPVLSDAIHRLVAPLCHQDPARSPWAFGHPLGACYRCIGVHVGLAIVGIGWYGERRMGDERAFPVLFGLGLLDWALCQTGSSIDHPLERLVAGAALGAGLALGVSRALRRVLRALRAARSQLRGRVSVP